MNILIFILSTPTKSYAKSLLLTNIAHCIVGYYIVIRTAGCQSVVNRIAVNQLDYVVDNTLLFYIIERKETYGKKMCNMWKRCTKRLKYQSRSQCYQKKV